MEKLIDVKELVKYIVDVSERDSIFATPMPQWELNTRSLLDYISGVTGIPKEQIGAWCKEAEDEALH